MKWTQIRQQYPSQWLLVEAIQAHSENSQRILDNLAVVATFADSVTALKHYNQMHQQAPKRELYVLHTDREQLNITERQWLGVRQGK